MPIITNPSFNKTKLRQKAIQYTIILLNKSPETLVEFLIDVTNGEYKKWYIFRSEYSRVIAEQSKGRPEPGSKKSGIPIARTERLVRMYRNWGKTYIPSLNLGKYHTPQEKVKAILSTDCSPEIKAELLEVVDYNQ